MDNNKNLINIMDATSVDKEKFKIKSELKKYASIAHMGQIVTSSPGKSIIGTTALDTCYGIVFYDRKEKFGIVGHGAPTTKISTLCEMIKMLGNNPRTIEYAIVLGFRNEERRNFSGVQELIEYLVNNCPINIKLVPFQTDLGVQVCSNTLAYEFAFEVNTGVSVSNYLFYEGETAIRKYYK